LKSLGFLFVFILDKNEQQDIFNNKYIMNSVGNKADIPLMSTWGEGEQRGPKRTNVVNVSYMFICKKNDGTC
jgi:hypothetical protein